MKKLLVLLLLLLGLTACGGTTPVQDTEPPAPADGQEALLPEDPDLEAFRKELKGGQAFAVAYLGQLENGVADLLAEYEEDFPFVASIEKDRIIRTAGKEVYCLIPASRDMGLLVQSWICNAANDYQGEVGETLYESSYGAPVILIGNENDVLPNLLVTLTDASGRTVTYHPARNLCDGGVELDEAEGYDFSIYHIDTGITGTASFAGHWYTTFPFEGYPLICDLTLNEDGTMAYTCGYAESDVGDFLKGTWYVIGDNAQYPPGSVIFEMTGFDEDEEEYTFWGIFTLTAEGNSLKAVHVNGDQLVYGYDTITFRAVS